MNKDLCLSPLETDFFITEVKKKKPNAFPDQLRLEEQTEGLCSLMMHLSSYDD